MDAPPQRTVSTTVEEGLLNDEVEPDDMEYWFSPPPEPWPDGPTRGRYLEEAAPDENNVFDDPWALDGEDRAAFEGIQEGQIARGRVIAIMAYAGLLVDFGAVVAGLIPATDNAAIDDWQAVPSYIQIGTEIEVCVFRVLRDTKLFRFPVVLVPTDPALAACFPPPQAHDPPMDLRGPHKDWTEIIRKSGRDYEPERILIPTGDEADAPGQGPEADDVYRPRRKRPTPGELREEAAMRERIDAVASWLAGT